MPLDVGVEVWRRVSSLLLSISLLRRGGLVGLGCQEILLQTEFSLSPCLPTCGSPGA